MSLRAKFKAALERRGETQVKATTRYLVYTARTSSQPGAFFYLGRAGALRIGESLTNSIPCSDKFKQHLEEN